MARGDPNLESSAHLDPMAYDKDGDIDYDDHQNEAIIPIGSAEQPSEIDTTRRTHKNAIITEADNPTAS